MMLHDTDMNPIGPATDEQITYAESADNGWIWLDPQDNPVNVQDFDDDTVTIDYGPIGGGGHGVGRIEPRDGYRLVCVA